MNNILGRRVFQSSPDTDPLSFPGEGPLCEPPLPLGGAEGWRQGQHRAAGEEGEGGCGWFGEEGGGGGGGGGGGAGGDGDVVECFFDEKEGMVYLLLDSLTVR